MALKIECELFPYGTDRLVIRQISASLTVLSPKLCIVWRWYDKMGVVLRFLLHPISTLSSFSDMGCACTSRIALDIEMSGINRLLRRWIAWLDTYRAH